MSDTGELLKTLRTKGYLGGLASGILVFGLIFSLIIGFNYSDFFYYLGHKQEFMEYKTRNQKLLKNYIKSNKENLDPFFENSKENQKKLLPIIANSNITSAVASSVLDISNREMDKFRIVSKINNYALIEFENKNFNQETQNLINNLFYSFKLILKNDKESYIEASGLLKDCYSKLNNKSEEIRLETLRYLTYCYFASNDKKNLDYWLSSAKKIKNSHTINYSNYIENYFWIDLLDLIVSIMNENIEDANAAFNSLNQNADPEFVEFKLLQHELRLSGKNLISWQTYIEKIKAEI